MVIDRTYQLNFGGNMDFKNMLERERLESKKISKTQSVTSQIDQGIERRDVHIGPSDHVPWLEDRKWAYIRLEGRNFGDVPLNVELKLEVWDSPNSAGVIIDAVRCAKIALDRGIGGPLLGPSAYFMKSPPVQYHDEEARRMVEDFADDPHRPTSTATVPTAGPAGSVADLRRRVRDAVLPSSMPPTWHPAPSDRPAGRLRSPRHRPACTGSERARSSSSPSAAAVRRRHERLSRGRRHPTIDSSSHRFCPCEREAGVGAQGDLVARPRYAPTPSKPRCLHDHQGLCRSHPGDRDAAVASFEHAQRAPRAVGTR